MLNAVSVYEETIPSSIYPRAVWRRWRMAKLHRVPVQPQPDGADDPGAKPVVTTLAVGLHVIGENRVREHRRATENIVEICPAPANSRELAAERTNRPAGKTTMREMIEEYGVRHETGHGHDAPAG